MPTQPDSSTLWSTRRKRRVATVHRTVAFTWVRVRRYFRCGRQDSTILRCEFRRAGIQQQSTGLLHLHGFEPVAISGAGDRTRLHYGAPGVEPPGGNSPLDCCILMGSSPSPGHQKREPPRGLSFLVRATGLEPARLSQRNLNPPSLPIPPRPRIACNRVILSWEPGNVNGRQPEPLKFPGGKGQFSQFLLSLSLTFRQGACKIS